MSKREETTIELEKVTYQRQGLVAEIATGFYGVIWSVTHPGKTALRAFGIVGGLAAVWFLLNFLAHLLAGSPGTAQAQGGDVGSWGRAAADTVRPVANNAANVVVGAEGYQTPVVIHTREWQVEEVQ
jgi:hypothetical protein